jgi:hypothetical protein
MIYIKMLTTSNAYCSKRTRKPRFDLPVEQPIKFDLVVSVPNAKALGLEVPANMLALANEGIE